MDHPLLSDLASLTDEEISEKVNSLTQKWFQTRNPEAQYQIQTMLDTYKLEMIDRSSKSKPEDGNRAVRKAIDRKRLAEAPAEAQFVKLADMIDNSLSIFVFDKSFAPKFAEEMALLVNDMTKVVGSSLWLEAHKVLKDGPVEKEDYSLRRSEV